ncbi:MAG TPA: glycosyltransferase family 39 protein, partial [Anaerolineales bacterium]
MNISLTRQRLFSLPWVAEGLGVLAGIAYGGQSWIYAHAQDSILDEGAYLYKGLGFITGELGIYQDYGPWSNHMPLSFYIPGAVQLLFGPGLRTARYFAIFVSMLMLLGLWLLARRLAGRWWAAAAVFALAWNPAAIKVYSVALTQGLIACMFVWMLVLVLDEKRSWWQIGLGSALAGAMILTRINLTPVLPLLVLYVFWQHGLRAGLSSALVSGLVVAVGHAFFWPGILRMWAYWLPEAMTPFLNAWRPPTGTVGYWDPTISLSSRAASFFHSFRFQFIPMVGALSVWLLWPDRDGWRNRADFRKAVLLSAIFTSLWLAHLWATMGKDYCVFCLAGYINFFSAAGILLVMLTFSSWRTQLTWWRQILIAVILVTLSTGIGFGAFEDIGDSLWELQISRLFVGQPLRFSESVPLGGVLENQFHLGYQVLRRLIPAAFGLAAGLAVLAGALLVRILYARRLENQKPSLGHWSVVIFFLLGTVMLPTVLLGGGYRTFDCSGDVIRSYEQIGTHLAQKIPAGSKVYWRGRLSAAPLLYLRGIGIYPPQLNGDYTYHVGGDPDALAEYGFWNQALAQRWAGEADFILIAR